MDAKPAAEATMKVEAPAGEVHVEAPRPNTRAQSKKRPALGDISNKNCAPANKQTKLVGGPVCAVAAGGAGAGAPAPEPAAPPAPVEVPREVAVAVVVEVAAPEVPAITDIDRDEGTRAYLDYVADHFTYLRSLEVWGRPHPRPPLLLPRLFYPSPDSLHHLAVFVRGCVVVWPPGVGFRAHGSPPCAPPPST